MDLVAVHHDIAVAGLANVPRVAQPLREELILIRDRIDEASSVLHSLVRGEVLTCPIVYDLKLCVTSSNRQCAPIFTAYRIRSQHQVVSRASSVLDEDCIVSRAHRILEAAYTDSIIDDLDRDVACRSKVIDVLLRNELELICRNRVGTQLIHRSGDFNTVGHRLHVDVGLLRQIGLTGRVESGAERTLSTDVQYLEHGSSTVTGDVVSPAVGDRRVIRYGELGLISS